jgi:hypothetical protein
MKECPISLAGLTFCSNQRSYTATDKSLKHVSRRVLEEARAKGRDDLALTQAPVQAGRRIPECLSWVRLGHPETLSETSGVRRRADFQVGKADIPSRRSVFGGKADLSD